jgi:pyridoxal phosphate enzyme (YggS family)
MKDLKESIADRINRVKERIERACERSGRAPNAVSILAVTKYADARQVLEAFRAGLRMFGENRVQEAVSKVSALPDLPVEWHMIGNLQTNKVKKALEVFSVIETVDRLKLVEALRRRLAGTSKTLRVFIQVKLSGEERKHGCSPEKLPRLAEALLESGCFTLEGLMTVPPYMENPEDVRPFFVRLRSLRDELSEKLGVSLPHLSMGMSHDFEVAVEEGATIVRIGSAIFGSRS